MHRLLFVAALLVAAVAGVLLAGFSVRAAALAGVLVLALSAPAVLLAVEDWTRRDRPTRRGRTWR